MNNPCNSDVNILLAQIVKLKFECRLKASTALGMAVMFGKGTRDHDAAIEECAIYKWVADRIDGMTCAST